MEWFLQYFVYSVTTSENLDLASVYNGSNVSIYVPSGSTTRSLVQSVWGTEREDIPWYFSPISSASITKYFVWPKAALFAIAPGETYHRYYRLTTEWGQEWWEDAYGIEGGMRFKNWNTVKDSDDRECADTTDCR